MATHMPGFAITDRYGGNPPDPATACKGQCEGLGWVPVHKSDRSEPWRQLFMTAEDRNGPSDDGYQSVDCPDCGGTGRVVKT